MQISVKVFSIVQSSVFPLPKEKPVPSQEFPPSLGSGLSQILLLDLIPSSPHDAEHSDQVDQRPQLPLTEEMLYVLPPNFECYVPGHGLLLQDADSNPVPSQIFPP